jgi:glycerophosphoryl diester phosphodiesterase
MSPTRRDLTAFALALPTLWSLAGPARALGRSPLVIAGGGAVGDMPAGVKGAFEAAIRDGADVLYTDFYPTRDGALAARPDHELSASTDVASRPEFAGRRADRVVDGRARSGWFVEDFTLAELKTLVCGAPDGRRRLDAQARAARAILTFEEVTAIARAGSVATGRVIGVQAGLPYPAYFAGLDLAPEARLAAAIHLAGYDSPAAAMWVMSADGDALARLGGLTRARRVLSLVATPGGEALASEALRTARTRAEVVAVDAARLLDLASPKTLPPTAVVADAHAAGLAVQAWISGPDPFPPFPFRPGDARRLIAALFAAGVDAVAGDLAAPIARARAEATPEDDG